MAMEGLPCYLGEFVGTYLLAFAVGCNLIVGTPVWAPISIAATLVVLVYAFASVSGAHLNPAVSLAMGMLGKLPWKKVGLYSLMQIFGAIFGALTYTLCFWKELPIQPAGSYNWFQVGLVEALYTCFLCFVVLNVAAANRGKDEHQYYGFAIGFSLVAAGYAASHISGSVLNPALVLGMNIMSSEGGFKWPFVYLVFELLGALIAATLFKCCRPDDDSLGRPGMAGNYTSTPAAKLAAEFTGTFFIVLTVGLNVLGESVQPMLSIGTSLMCMTFALRNVSGAIFNPASTLAVYIGTYNNITSKETGLYIAMQCAAGIIGAFFYTIIEHGHTFPLEPGKDFGWLHVACAEIIFTTVLVFVFLSVSVVSVDRHGDNLREYQGVAIGLTAIGSGIAVGIISGGVLNPAISMGVSTVHMPRGGIRQFWHGCFYVLSDFVK